MSVPARRLPEPEPVQAPRRAPSAPTPGRRPPEPRQPRPASRPSGAPARSRGGRRRAHLGFVTFSGLVVTALIVGVVTLNALLAQTAFQMRTAQGRVAALQQEAIILTEEAARMSSPVVVATWARRHDMVMPEVGTVHILRVPGSDR